MTKQAPSVVRPRLGRLFRLAEAEAYPGTDGLDSVLYWLLRGTPDETEIRVWLRTTATTPRSRTGLGHTALLRGLGIGTGAPGALASSRLFSLRMM
jgi:hypothetical protein